jgi:hypothetical protein
LSISRPTLYALINRGELQSTVVAHQHRLPETSVIELLVRDGDEVFLCRVEPGFVEALAAVKPATIKPLAAEWGKTEGLEDWGAVEVESALRALVKFADWAKREGKPVVQLSVL